MSSTARGTVRNANDYYVTPLWMVDEFLERFVPEYSIDVNDSILDPCAGGCDKYEMSYPTVLAKHGFKDITTIDIREDSRAENKGVDYIKAFLDFDIDLVITNPSFEDSVEITNKALSDVKNRGFVVMLQRLNWLGSQKRKSFWDDAPLREIYVHRKRAGFDPEKPNKTDSIEYAHFVFQKGYQGSVSLSII
ncbi:SAM-dependent methyltransferase [Thalassotalea sp. 1_MG-2023]|uniref:SAM-dependent methyltransferase n=1 Tax=Thalassotalea sp. 1_MG-2023 TaxID=3062680 RepID=UPI0026E21B4C|nr:SAM-dependent methyltransferase [Thalassotalea sp. 1_MG-2023]MDO6426201.1 SAM-dependent methyltransferase [Thalassotalea sp. 1_MG-2023]